MQVDDAMLFIDANKYLDLYQTNKGNKLLALLGEQSEYIFVTQQVVREVKRNKIKVAAKFLSQKFKRMKLQTFNIPDHLSGVSVEQGQEILQQMKKISQNIKKVNDEVDALALSIIEQISCSEDEVSKALSLIFAKAVAHSPEELQRAKARKELGHPPGKYTDPIGDQLIWEQILSHFKEKKRLWIISRDGDYGTFHGGNGFLNRFLFDELSEVESTAKIYLFNSTIEGINHFVETTGVKADKRLTKEEAEEVEKEEKSLPPLSLARDVARHLFGNVEASQAFGGFYQQSKVARRMFPNEGAKRQLNMLSGYEGSIQRAIDNLSGHSEDLPRKMDKPDENQGKTEK